MPPIEPHWCNKCGRTTDHMKVKALWKCNECLARKLKGSRRKALVPKPVKLESKVNAVCPCCGAGMKITVEAIV